MRFSKRFKRYTKVISGRAVHMHISRASDFFGQPPLNYRVIARLKLAFAGLPGTGRPGQAPLISPLRRVRGAQAPLAFTFNAMFGLWYTVDD